MNKKTILYGKICDRAETYGFVDDRVSLLMDIQSADLKFSLRLEDWLAADDFNFIHDIVGIMSNIKRDEFPATDFGLFVPRFAGMVREQ